MASATNRQWSADYQFLEELTTLKRWFMDCDICGNIYGMSNAVKLLLIICEPKLTKFKPEEEKKRIKWIEDNLHMIQYFNSEGKIVETDATRANKKTMMAHLEQTFSNILNKLQKAGVYTRANTESREALGDFSGS
jgi:hypothetical protein